MPTQDNYDYLGFYAIGADLTDPNGAQAELEKLGPEVLLASVDSVWRKTPQFVWKGRQQWEDDDGEGDQWPATGFMVLWFFLMGVGAVVALLGHLC